MTALQHGDRQRRADRRWLLMAVPAFVTALLVAAPYVTFSFTRLPLGDSALLHIVFLSLHGVSSGAALALGPFQCAMLVNEGVDVESIEQVVVGFDPSVLPRGQVQSLTGYKSNEPALLADAGEQVTQWDPEDAGLTGSFAAMAFNPDSLADHPTAAQDFLRAALRAFAYCQGQAQEYVGFAAAPEQTGGYDIHHNLDVWKTEQRLVTSATSPGTPLSYLNPARTRAEAADVGASGLLDPDPDVEAAFDDSALAEIYAGETVVWPVP